MSNTLIAATLVGMSAAIITYREDSEHPVLTGVVAGGLGGILTMLVASAMQVEMPLVVGELVKITTPHGSGDDQGEIAQVHPGPAYAVMIDGKPHRWYVGEEMRPL